MSWVVSPALLVEALLAIALVVLVPSGTATLIAGHDRRTIGRIRTGARIFRILSYAMILVALGVFLLTNHLRVEDIVFS